VASRRRCPTPICCNFAGAFADNYLVRSFIDAPAASCPAGAFSFAHALLGRYCRPKSLASSFSAHYDARSSVSCVRGSLVGAAGHALTSLLSTAGSLGRELKLCCVGMVSRDFYDADPW
jgi:hypothetical protein